MTRPSCRLLVAAVVLFAAGCGQKSEPPEPEMQEGQTAQSWVPPNEQAPATYRVRFETNEGDFVVEVVREWAPHGADRFYNLVKTGFYDGCRFFRVLPGFVVQWGINGDPRVQKKWDKNIPPDKVVESNTRGTMTYAMGGRPDTRSTQVFINLGNNSRLDADGFAPFGRVVSGMDVVSRLYGGYGEGSPRGRGPAQGRIQREGNTYLKANFPRLDYIKQATLVAAPADGPDKSKTAPSPDSKKTAKKPRTNQP